MHLNTLNAHQLNEANLVALDNNSLNGDLAWSNDGDLVIAGDTQMIVLSSHGSRNFINIKFKATSEGIYSLTKHPDLDLFCVGIETGLILWDKKNDKLLKFSEREQVVNASFCKHRSHLVTVGGHSRKILLWQWQNAKLIKVKELLNEDSILSCCFIGDNDILIGNLDTQVYLLKAPSLEIEKTLNISVVFKIAVSNDNSTAALGTLNGEIYLINLKEWKIENILNHEGGVRSILFGFDHSTLISSGIEDGTLKIWDWKKSKAIKKITPKGNGFITTSLNQVGDTLATVSADGVVQIWSAK
jgi:WD40 repeat protein